VNRLFRRGKREAKQVSLALLVGFLLFLSLAKEDWIRLATNNWSELTFMWSDLTFLWSDLTIVWSDLTIVWSDLTIEWSSAGWFPFIPIPRQGGLD